MTTALDAYEQIRREVVARLGDDAWSAPRSDDRIRDAVVVAVDDYQSRAHHGDHAPLHDPAAMTDLGALSELLARHGVEEIFIEGARVSYLDDRGRLRGWVMPTSEDENRRAIEQLLAATDRQLHATSPLVQARVLDGTARLTAAIPPVADRLSATLRRYTVRSVSLERLVALGSIEPAVAAFLAAMMRFRSRVAVSGERPPALDGSGEIALRQLVKFVLAMRPDRIVVGEVRGAEAFELTRAINAGCGFVCTVHANSAPEALHALVNAALMAGENVTERVVQRVFSSALDLVVHVERRDAVGGAGARRQVSAITAVVPALTDGFTCEPIFVRDSADGPLRWTGSMPERLEHRADRALGGNGTLRAVLDAGGRA
jgi:pilus assembly protein CpaF